MLVALGAVLALPLDVTQRALARVDSAVTQTKAATCAKPAQAATGKTFVFNDEFPFGPVSVAIRLLSQERAQLKVASTWPEFNKECRVDLVGTEKHTRTVTASNLATACDMPELFSVHSLHYCESTDAMHGVVASKLGEFPVVAKASTTFETQIAQMESAAVREAGFCGFQCRCFDKRSTSACLLTASATTAIEAYESCFGGAADAQVEAKAVRVRMGDLTAGDRVLTASKEGALAVTRVIVNQHAGQSTRSPMLTVRTSDGASVSMTPTHAVYVDGKLQAASHARPGATLRNGRGDAVTVTKVTAREGTIINPFTVTGTILASDTGEPVLAATATLELAAFFIESSTFPAYSLQNLLSRTFPATYQAYFNAVLDPNFAAGANTVLRLQALLPFPIFLILTAVLDVLCACGFVAHCLAYCLVGAAKLAAGLAALFGVRRVLSSMKAASKLAD